MSDAPTYIEAQQFPHPGSRRAIPTSVSALRSVEVDNVTDLQEYRIKKRLLPEMNEYLHSCIAARSEVDPQKKDAVASYFTSVDEKLGISPLERMAKLYDYLPLKEGVGDAMLAHSKRFLELAFEQHLENPEQFVSHGFNHSIMVAEYTKNILGSSEAPKPIVSEIAIKYGITHAEARFLAEMTAFFHDFGYPSVKGRSKAVHSMEGARIVASPELGVLLDALITSSDAQKDLIKKDISNAILFHTAAKKERVFPIKITTGFGEVLATPEHFATVAQSFRDSDSDHLTVVVQDEATKIQVLTAGVSDIVIGMQETGIGFEGMYIDLEKKGDKKMGLEYTRVDIMKDPLAAIIRLADKMDMSRNRFSAVQNEPAFQEIYHAFGNNGETSRILQSFEELTQSVKSGKISEEAGLAEAKRRLTELARVLQDEHFTQGTPDISLVQEAEMKWKKYVIRDILGKPEYQTVPEPTKDAIWRITKQQDSKEIVHFGGCESIVDVTCDIPQVIAHVDKPLHNKLNTIVVKEEGVDMLGDKDFRDVRVGEYQLQRFKDALESITFGVNQVSLVVQDTEGNTL